MLKPARILTRTLLFVTLFGLAYFFSDIATWGFTIARLRTTRPLGPSGGVDPYLILKQKFYLKDQGGQSYVFISSDEKYVLKFFKDMPRPWIPFNKYQKKKLGKLIRTINGYHLAFERLPQETGLLYLHFSPTSSPLPTILVDRLAIEHSIDLSSVYFVLQKRATPVDSFSESTLARVSDLLKKRASAHIADHDPRLQANLGWIDGQLVFIDPGRFVEDANASAELPKKFLERLP
jgi:nitrogen fixation protein